MNLRDDKEGIAQAQAQAQSPLLHDPAPSLTPLGTDRFPKCKFVRVPTSGLTLAYETYGDASGTPILLMVSRCADAPTCRPPRSTDIIPHTRARARAFSCNCPSLVLLCAATTSTVSALT